ncbi:Phospholipase A2 family protein [Prunus dulcis]|uniref:Phospholipase A2 family protein n=1 Tax=Prunus dulcis TaxID=3755 RepID=A0A4Y1QLM4_PRUDU|nr:Phospholipase A2 family protein [Prunus dulcis]
MCSLKFVLALSFLVLYFDSIHVNALNIGVQATDASIVLLLSNHNMFSLPINAKNLQSKDCSRHASIFKIWKVLWTLVQRMSREEPCDGLDECCMKHDACVQSKNNDYLSSECSQQFLNCMAEFRNSKGKTFNGNTCHVQDVVEVITLVMEAALVAGRYLHKP